MQDYQAALTFKTEEKKDYLVLIFDGALDKAGLDEFREKIEKAIEDTSRNIVAMDFTSLTFINSEAIGFLLTLHMRLVKRQKKLTIFGAADHVLDVLNVIGMLKIIESYATEEDLQKTISS